MKLNLEAKTPAEQKVKSYLEQNASEVLARKINEGVKIVKDGKTLLNKKTLAGFLKYACDEAKKQAEKGAHSACIDDAIVYGWAVHYFEEDGIEGTLYNEDGTEYKAPMSKSAPPPTKYEPPKPKPKPQMSIFDMMAADEQKQPAEEADDEPTDENYAEADEAVQEPLPPPAKPQGSPVWQRYVDPETGEVINELSEEEMRQFDGDIAETLPSVQNEQAEETDLDISAFDPEAVAILSELFSNELELR